MNKRTGSNAERFGRGLARMCRGYTHREHQVVSRLVAKGVPTSGAIVFIWIVKIAMLVVLLYTALWLVLLLVLAVMAAWLARNADTDEEKQPELRDGHSGVGLYDKDDWKIDMSDPNDP